MNFLPAWKYQMDGMKWPLIIFYIVIAALLALMGIAMSIVIREHNQFSVGGLETASAVFIFIAGLNSFKSTFHMFSANGISRKTMFISFIAAIGVVAVGMAVVDGVYSLIMRTIGNYEPAFMQMYGLDPANGAYIPTALLWMFCSNLAAGMTGYLITTLYYRMNKAVKLLASIGVPVLLLFVLPIVDAALFNGVVMNTIGWFIGWASGLASGNPYMGVISNILLTVVCGILSFVALRRAPVKARQQ